LIRQSKLLRNAWAGNTLSIELQLHRPCVVHSLRSRNGFFRFTAAGQVADLAAEDLDDAELQRVKDNYPVVWKNPDAQPKLCFMGCPHMSLQQLKDWTEKVEEGLKYSGNKKVVIPTVFTAAPKVLEKFNQTEYAQRLKNTGVITSYICPLMYMNNPLCKTMPVITSSNKLRTYTSARYYTDEEIVIAITKGGKNNEKV